MEKERLLLPPTVPPERLSALCRQAAQIVGLIDRGEPSEEKIAGFNEATGRAYGPQHFGTFPGAEDAADFVKRALRPERPQVPDISRDELVEVVRRIREASEEIDHYLTLFEANVPHPAASDLISWPPDELMDASNGEIVDTALAHQPIPGPK